MDKPFSWADPDDSEKSFVAVLHLSTFGAFKSADVSCRNLKLAGLSQDQFLKLIYDGIGPRADALDVAQGKDV